MEIFVFIIYSRIKQYLNLYRYKSSTNLFCSKNKVGLFPLGFWKFSGKITWLSATRTYISFPMITIQIICRLSEFSWTGPHSAIKLRFYLQIVEFNLQTLFPFVLKTDEVVGPSVTVTCSFPEFRRTKRTFDSISRSK